jgi:hypothetical protein
MHVTGAPYLQTTVLGVRQMSSSEALTAKHVRVPGILSIIGLLLVGLSLVWDSPISTYLIIYVGAALVLTGAGLFLYLFITHFLARRHM